MSKIPVYEIEKKDGVAELVRANASIAYVVQPQVLKPSQELTEKVLARHFSQSSLTDTDLYHVKSILASTNWNKNDDVFDLQEVWASRHTPVHKPDNLNHNDQVIIGHMVDCWAIDEDGAVIADDTSIDKLPTMFHLVNNSVIYTTWSTDSLKKQVAELIEKIEKGEAFVSMECLFKGFDYAIQTPDGENKVVARSAETAFLTKHLRAYGGKGEYQDYKIGRLMRNMVFVGKGYVDKPANPESIVFTPESAKKFYAPGQINTIFDKNGVLISCKANSNDIQETSDMSDTNKVLEDQVAELKAAVKLLTDKNESLAQSASQAAVDGLKAENKTLSDKLEAAEKHLETAKSELTTVKTAAEKAAADLAELNSAKASVMEELQKMQVENTKAQRVNTLVAGGIDEVSAKATVEKFTSLDDAQFAAIAELAIKAAFPPKDEDKKDDKKDKKDGKKDAKANLDDAETNEEEVSLGGTGEEDTKADEANELRTALASWIETQIGQGSK